MPPSSSISTRRGPRAPKCSHTEEDPGPPLKEKVSGRSLRSSARSATYAMKKMWAWSSSFFSSFTGSIPVVTEYLSALPEIVASWLVTTGSAISVSGLDSVSCGASF